MAKTGLSTKRLAISKANTQMVAVVALASFLSVFCLVASHAVFSQIQYQSRVTSKKELAHRTLQQNIQTFDKLLTSYNAFNDTATNVIGGNTGGTGDNDGNNTKIILDALPSTYDFPGVTSSVEKILTDRQFKITNITGTDDQINQQGNISNPNPQPVKMPFSFTVSNANYTATQQLITALQQSIRPIQIDTLDISGGANDMQLTVNAHTYFQPGKNLTITKQVVK